MKNTDLVSIVMPAYKAAAYIEDAIRSVQQQDCTDWELLVVDDGSPDDTAGKVGKLADHDRRIKLIRQANAGPAMARQRAIVEARGRYIAFLDSDDYWLPEKLSRQLALMRSTGAGLTYTGFRRITHDGALVGELIAVPKSLDYRELLRNTAIATSSAVVDRSLTGPFEMRRAYYDDFVLWLELLKRGIKARGLNEDLLRYRVVSKSVSRNKLKSAREVWRTYREIEHLSLGYSAWCLSNYALNALLKYRKF